MTRKICFKAMDALIGEYNFMNSSINTRDGVLYSYKMPIARMVGKPSEKRIEMVDREDSPSRTTSCHIGDIRHLAIEAGYTVEKMEKEVDDD